MIASTDQEMTATSIYTVTIDSLAVTSAAIVATWPVIAYHFGSVSLIALPANFFAIPVLPPIIVTVALISVTGLWLPLAAEITGWVAWLFLSYFILVVQVFNALPFSSIKLVNISTWQVWIYYSALIIAIVILTHRNQFANFVSSAASTIIHYSSSISKSIPKVVKKWSLLSLLIAVTITWTAFLNIPDDKLHVHILDVGQGDAILIQTPGHQNILIDGGPSPQAINLELSKKLPFWDKTIDLMILTQPQSDHITGLIEVLKYYKVKQVLEPGIPFDSFIYTQWLKLVKSNEIRYSRAHAGQEINLGTNIIAEVLHPPISLLQDTSDDINNNGLVLRLNYNSLSFLFTADIGEEAEQYLISKRANLQSTVLKVAHHGSRSSTSAELLAVVAPDIAVISAGKNNNFGHPHPEVMAKLNQRIDRNKLFITSNNGTIEFITDGNKLWVKTEY